MTPAARVAAAAEILDRALAGMPAEQALTTWGRANRFAGSGDRAAIRDLVFDALRRRRSCAWLGGAGEAATGRALMLGALRAAGGDPAAVFSGARHAPAALSPEEAALCAAPPALPGDVPEGVALDCPDWLLPHFKSALGADCPAVLRSLRDRAPVHLRVNLARNDRDEAIAALAEAGITAVPHPLADTALEVVANAQRIRQAAPYLDGRVELQDAASQAVAAALPVPEGGRVLDYCAGGGGKTLAMAARVRARYHAHDAAPARMRDLPLRAERAGVQVRLLDGRAVAGAGPYDLVLLDVPCSGSGSWRRAPEAKWTFTPERLAALLATQAEILDKTAGLVAQGGTLAYATCSLLKEENIQQVEAFIARSSGWRMISDRQFTPLDGGDGFYLALLAKS